MREVRRKNRGVASVEMALVLPLLLLITAGVLELGRALALRQSLDRVTYEISRYAASVPSLKGQSAFPPCDLRTEGQCSAPVSLVAARLSVLLEKYEIKAVPEKITISFQNGGVASESRIVEIEVTYRFDQMLKNFGIFPSIVSSHATAPYLYS